VQGIRVTTAYCWHREGTLPVLARKAGRLILVSPRRLPPRPRRTVGLYARDSCHDHRADLDRQVARLPAWSARTGLPVVRVRLRSGPG
jgi:predicted site-specific integrase-resolvase